jgi:hypothetical protein
VDDYNDDLKTDCDSVVTLTELLRLKRHEKPSPDFWENFDVQLQKRAFQCVVRKKSLMSLCHATLFHAWTVRLSLGLAVLACGIYSILPTTETSIVLQSNISTSSAKSNPVTIAVIVPSELSDKIEFIDGALTLADSSGSTGFNTAFPTNALHAVSSDSINYAEESLITLLAESEPSDRRAIF